MPTYSAAQDFAIEGLMTARNINEKRIEHLRFWTLAALVAASLVLGGASRLDVLSLMVIQPFAVLSATLFLLSSGPIRWASINTPLLLLGGLASVMAAQLVPLPPMIWMALPGHGEYAATAAAAGIEQPWRSMSLTPDLTMSSLVSLTVPLAVLIGFASVPPERTRGLLALIIVVAALGAVVGLAQLAGGPHSPFYFYDVTNTDSPVGFFSNRNHQAVMLALCWPALTVWATLPTEPHYYAIKRWVAVGFAIFILPMLLVGGSRAGLALGIGAIITAFLFWRRRDLGAPQPERWSLLLIPTALGAALCVIGATFVLSRDTTVERMTGVSFEDETRWQYLPTLFEMARDFFPVGSGFGSFEPLFRSYEPFELLQATYLNHAHNEIAELVITGGLPALAILLAFVAWLGLRALAVLRVKDTSTSVTFARLGLVMIVILLLASVVDYPLRTPAMAALLAIACGWLSGYGRRIPRT